MSTFTRKPGQPFRCDVCRAPVPNNTWPVLRRHHLEHHAPAIYHATRAAEQETDR